MGLREDEQKFKSCKLKNGSIIEYHAMGSGRNDYPENEFVYLGEGVMYQLNGFTDLDQKFDNPDHLRHFWRRATANDGIGRLIEQCQKEGNKELEALLIVIQGATAANQLRILSSNVVVFAIKVLEPMDKQRWADNIAKLN